MKNPHRHLDVTQLSPTIRALNPHLEAGYRVPVDQHPPYRPGEAPPEPKRLGKRRKEPNKTELAFGRLLEAQKARGHILRYEFEAMAFRWGGTADDTPMLYSPDWIVFDTQGLRLIEVKGGHIFDRDIVRFKGCRAAWPEFRWEMWQFKEGSWTKIH